MSHDTHGVGVSVVVGITEEAARGCSEEETCLSIYFLTYFFIGKNMLINVKCKKKVKCQNPFLKIENSIFISNQC